MTVQLIVKGAGQRLVVNGRRETLIVGAARGARGAAGVGEKGDKGDPGDDGPPGASVHVIGHVPNEAALPLDGNNVNDAYVNDANGHLYVWSADDGWVDVGQFKGDKGDQGDPGDDGGPGPPGQPGTSIHIVGTVDDVSELPATGNTVGDVWTVQTADGVTLYQWTGALPWVSLGGLALPPARLVIDTLVDVALDATIAGVNITANDSSRNVTLVHPSQCHPDGVFVRKLGTGDKTCRVFPGGAAFRKPGDTTVYAIVDQYVRLHFTPARKSNGDWVYDVD